MTLTFAQLNARRAWYVPGVTVWGDLAALTLPAIGTEIDDSETRVVFYEFTLGGAVQEIPFESLTDHRGNTLPQRISKPAVIPIPRNAISVAVVAQPTDTAFRLAKSVSAPGDGLVDLWIIEVGD